MAILNFIKDGTYTRIANVNWDRGIVTDVQVDVFASKPDNAYMFKEDYDDTNNMNPPEREGKPYRLVQVGANPDWDCYPWLQFWKGIKNLSGADIKE